MIPEEVKCSKCGWGWNSPAEAEQCCNCYICGAHTEMQPCEQCYGDRHCECCNNIFDGPDSSVESNMHYGCQWDGDQYDENQLCHDCWLERQPPLVQLGDCAE